MKKLVGLAISCCLMSVAATAGAGEWAQTFDEESLPQELFDVSVVVAAEGPQSERIGQVLVGGLDERGVGEARMSPAMDRIGARSDDDVVAELAHLPADVVVTVRTYDEDFLTQEDVEILAQIGLEDDVSVSDEASIPLDANLSADLGRMAVYAIDGTFLGKTAVRPGQFLEDSERRAIGDEITARVLEAEEPLVHAEPLHDETEDVDEDESVDEESEEKAEKEEKSGEEATDDDEIGEPEYEERYAVNEAEDSLILRDQWEDETLRDASMYMKLDEDWLEEFRSNRASSRRRVLLSVVSVTAGGIAAGIGAQNWSEARGEEIPNWKREICHQETVLEQRQECVDDVHSELYGRRIRGGQATVAAGAAVVGLGVVTFIRAQRMSRHPVSTEEVVDRVDAINDDEDWDEFQRRRLEKQRQREEEQRRREKQEPGDEQEPEEKRQRRDGGGLQVHRNGPGSPMKASSRGIGDVDVHPYVELGDGVGGGIAVRLEW